MLINKYLIADRYQFGALHQISDYFFKSVPTLQLNPGYGYLQAIGEDDQIDNRGKLYEKAQANINFNSEKYAKLLKSCQKDNATKIFINWEQFYQMLSSFQTEVFSTVGIKGDLSSDELVSLLKMHNCTQHVDSKIFLGNVLICVYLRIFKEKFSARPLFYYIFKFDFRGRKYYESIISITNFKLKRLCVFYGYFTSSQLDETVKHALTSRAVSVIRPLIGALLPLYSLMHSSYNPHFTSNERLRPHGEFLKFLAIQFFIAIGVIFKSKILNDKVQCSDGFTLSTEIFFNQGVAEFLNWRNPSIKYFEHVNDSEDILKLKFYFNALTNGIDLKKKLAIGLDFSCSGHQLRYLLNDLNEENSYKLINIDGWDKYTDIYSFITKRYKDSVRSVFLNKNDKTLDLHRDDDARVKNPVKPFHEELVLLFKTTEELEDIFMLLTRSTLKKSLMTGEYNIKFPAFFNYFIEKLPGGSRGAVYLANREKLSVLIKGLFRFSLSLENNTKEFSSGNRLGAFFVLIETSGYLLEMWDGFPVGLASFLRLDIDKRVTVVFIKNNKKTRFTHKLTVYSDIIDKASTKTALMPNFIHAIDGSLVRKINLNNEQPHSYLSVHDEFWIPFQLVFHFKDQVNTLLQEHRFTLNSVEVKRVREPSATTYCYNIIL